MSKCIRRVKYQPASINYIAATTRSSRNGLGVRKRHRGDDQPEGRAGGVANRRGGAVRRNADVARTQPSHRQTKLVTVAYGLHDLRVGQTSVGRRGQRTPNGLERRWRVKMRVKQREIIENNTRKQLL